MTRDIASLQVASFMRRARTFTVRQDTRPRAPDRARLRTAAGAGTDRRVRLGALRGL